MRSCLCIDQGNGHCHMGWFENGTLVRRRSVRNEEAEEVLKCLEGEMTNGIIYCSVSKEETALRRQLERLRAGRLVAVGKDTPLPIEVRYSRDEMGGDRVAAAVGAYKRHKGRNVLVVDLGTAITYDVVTEDGKLEGGNIAPGLQMRLDALHERTDRLRRVEVGGEVSLIGRGTEEAIRNGVANGIEFEITGYAEELRRRGAKDLMVILTGGDGKYFEKRMKSKIFAQRKIELVYEEDLVLEGLNAIIECS